jgi:signal transduction histidine kinase/CheY-like chemotaxis protein
VNSTWKEKRLEIITLGVFLVLVLTSLLFLYNSYTNYSLLISSDEPSRAFVHQIIMGISTTILFVSLMIVYIKRDYFFQEKQESTDGLNTLFEEIKSSSDKDKVEEFKQMLKEKNHIEIYGLISNMINELHERKESTDEANKIKTLFLSNMSHEIRTPITGIVGFTNLLSTTSLSREQREFVDTIRKSSENLLGLVNNLLDVSNIEHGKFELNKSGFTIMSEIETFIESYTLDALEKEITFSVWVDPSLSLLSIEGDVEKIKQILTNLLSNAIKFTLRGGEVNLTVKKANLTDKNVKIQFLVSDTGIGIDEKQKREVFKLFSQADTSNTRAYSGVGLGLTIANNLVKMMGGVLTIDSEVEQGTTFSFSLEMKRDEAIKKSEVSPLNIAIYSSKKVQETTENNYLNDYLSSFDALNLVSYKSYVACKEAEDDAFDALYLHYDEINLEELKRVVAQYSSEKQIVLVTKLSNRDEILDIAPIFSQIVYEPMTFPKIENSLKVIENNRVLTPLKKEENFALKALIVEDSLVNQKVIVHTLKSIGIESDTANNGEIGVAMFKKNQYDIIFMDIQMPVMNGVVATKHILEYELRQNLDHTPIVAVTTNALDGDRELYLSSGMDDYISKPISMEKFLRVIKQFYASSDKSLEKKPIEEREILFYKKNPTEAKIFSTLLQDIGYSVTVAKNREEFYYLMEQNSYKLFILDKRKFRHEDEVLMEKIYHGKIPTLFFMDEKSILSSVDINAYTQVMYKRADFSVVKEQLKKMLEL